MTTINRIRVEKLFDQYSFELDLETSENVSVFIGPNGIGKTSVLNILSFLLFPTLESFERIIHIPFTAYEVTLSNDLKLKLYKDDAREKEAEFDPFIYASGLCAYLHQPDLSDYCFGKPGVWFLQIEKNSEIKEIVLGTGDGAPEIGGYVNIPEKKDRLQRYNLEFCDYIGKFYIKELVQMYIEMRIVAPNLLFIRSDRTTNRFFLEFCEEKNILSRSSHARSLFDVMCNDLKSIVRRATGAYKKNIQAAHQKLLKSYIGKDEKSVLTLEEFKQRWTNYCTQLRQLIDIGFLNETDIAPDIGDLDTAYAQKGEFLTVYLETFERTLEPLLEEYKCWKKLAEIIDKRNEATGKRLQFTPDGVKMLTNGRLIEVDRLSSGEQNDLVMFYTLLATPNSLIIIDEPEISWHIVWQEDFLDQLLDICRMRNLQAIVTTHSPNIINGHFELIAQRSEI